MILREVPFDQPEAIGLYVAEGYEPMPTFGAYRGEPDSRCYSKIVPCAGRVSLRGR